MLRRTRALAASPAARKRARPSGAADDTRHAARGDIRGNGESAAPIEPAWYATERHIPDVLAVADACAVAQFTLWGFSYGGNIGRYVAVASDRVDKLVLVGASS